MKMGAQTPSGPPTDGAIQLATSDGRVVCGDLDIRIDRDGIWYYHGSPIGRKELVCLFASVLTMDEAGAYWLVTPGEKGRVQVDDAPFMAVELFSAGDGRDRVLSLRTNIDELVPVDRDHPIEVVTNPETGEPSPYVTLRGPMRAKIVRSVYYELVAMGREETIDNEKVYGVWSSGAFFPIGTVDPDD
jgi:hypothetical protein